MLYVVGIRPYLSASVMKIYLRTLFFCFPCFSDQNKTRSQDAAFGRFFWPYPTNGQHERSEEVMTLHEVYDAKNVNWS